MRNTMSALILTLSAVPALSQTAMTGAQFEAYATGKTLFYNSGGEAYGIEQYLPGREVRWAFVGDECKDGYWYEEAEYICFVYEDYPDPQCWTFYETPGGVQARFRGDTLNEPLIAVSQSQEPLACAGPDLGV